MLYSEMIAVCSESHTKHINTLCGQNVEFVNVKPGGTYSNHWALKVKPLEELELEYISLAFNSVSLQRGQ
jgi:hypothetical protein